MFDIIKKMIDGYGNEYTTSYTLAEKINFTSKMKKKYPDRVPVIIKKATNEKILQDIENTKFLIPKNLRMSDLLMIIRKNIKLDSNKAIFLFAGQNLIPMNGCIGEIYETYHNPDTFLYIFYTLENTFG
jgi:GABA(A) receptor-associated protein